MNDASEKISLGTHGYPVRIDIECHGYLGSGGFQACLRKGSVESLLADKEVSSLDIFRNEQASTTGLCLPDLDWSNEGCSIHVRGCEGLLEHFIEGKDAAFLLF